MKLKPIVLAALACICAAGCRTTKDVLDDYEKNLSLGNYGGSTPELLELADKRDDSQLLWRLMAAATLHFTNTREADAIRQFDLAEAVLQKNDQTSVFAQGGEGALAMMTNDRAFSYDGGGLDRIFTCVYRGIDFLCTGNRDNARVEFNRAAQYQRNWLYDRRKDIDAAAQKLESDAASYQKQQNAQAVDTSGPVNAAMADSAFGAQIREQTGFDPATSGRLDALSQAAYVNAYAAHLAGVFRWVNGDNGLDDLKLAAAVKPGDACVARDFAECSRGGKPSNQVWVWVEDGLCPTREEWRIDLPFVFIPYARRYVLYAGMALPRLRERAYGATVWNALGIAADHASDSRTQLALRLSQVGVATWAATSTAADLRSWTALPKRVLAVRLNRPADGVVQVVAGGQTIPVTVPEGNSLVFIRKPAPSAPPVVKMATFQ